MTIAVPPPPPSALPLRRRQRYKRLGLSRAAALKEQKVELEGQLRLIRRGLRSAEPPLRLPRGPLPSRGLRGCEIYGRQQWRDTPRTLPGLGAPVALPAGGWGGSGLAWSLVAASNGTTLP